MNCLIVDDEPIAIKVIETHLKEFEDLVLVGTCRSAMQAFTILQNTRVDLLFLDIEMPKLDGLSFIKTLQNPPLVLITTAHRKFALDGFDLDAVDYLLKPISLDRFMQAIAKAQRLYRPPNLGATAKDPQNPLETASHIYVKSDRENLKINLGRIQYIESLKNHVKIVTDRESHITMVSIGEMEKKLPEHLFLRIHRSFLINVEHIQHYTNSYIVINKKSFPIGSVYKKNVLNSLDKNRI